MCVFFMFFYLWIYLTIEILCNPLLDICRRAFAKFSNYWLCNLEFLIQTILLTKNYTRFTNCILLNAKLLQKHIDFV